MDTIAGMWSRVQRALLYVEDALPPLTESHRHVVFILEVVRVEELVPSGALQWLGRKRLDRRPLARAFVAKALLNLPHTKALLDRLQVDRVLRQLCGWEQGGQIPSEATFSRAFAEFAALGLLDRVHEQRVREYLGEEVIWHLSRDATEIEAREAPTPPSPPPPRFPRGRPKQGEVRVPRPPSRLVRQYAQAPHEALAELPTACDRGHKLSGGHMHYWIGYKLHLDVGDGGIPLTAVTTSASLHDSQVALPLMKLTAARVGQVLYELMDRAYDAAAIAQLARVLGHVPIIPAQERHHPVPELEPDRARRFQVRTQSERVNSHLKEAHGGRFVRVQGHAKVHTHLMFGVLVIFAEALLGLGP